MSSVENRVLLFVQKNIFWLCWGAGLLGSLLLRALLLPVQSADMEMFLVPWYEEIVRGGGFDALANHSANYNAAYLILLWVATLLPADPVTAIKLISMAGDLLLGVAVGLVVWQLSGGRPRRTALGFLLVGLLPLCVLNSAYWGQCDALYTGFLVLAVWAALRERWLLMFVWVGAALCFKLQAIFFLPFLLILYVLKRKFSIWMFLVPPAMLLLSGMPLVFVGGRVSRVFSIYAEQVEYNQNVFVNYYNVSSFFRWQRYEELGKFLILGALLALLALFCIALYRRLDFSGDTLLLLAAVGILVCVVFLPGMHERYAFSAEVLLCLWLFCKPSVRRLVPTAITYLIGFMSSSRFLFGIWADGSPYLGLLNLVNLLWLCYQLLFVEARPLVPPPRKPPPPYKPAATYKKQG